MKIPAVCLAVPMLAACASADSGNAGTASGVVSRLHPYRIDVRQGNLVTQEMVSQLRPGLSKDQVRFILGTPLLNDVFHAERWDYLYRLQKGADGSIQQRHLAVFFQDGKLVRLGGDVVAEAAAGAPERPATRMIEIMPRESEGRPDGAKPEAAAPAAASQ